MLNFDDPKIVGSSEYWAIHTCLSDALEDFTPDDPDNVKAEQEDYAAGMLAEFISHAASMLFKLGKKPVLQIAYYEAGVPPNVTWPEGFNDTFELLFVDADAKYLEVFVYNGITIYHAVRANGISACCYAVVPRCDWECDEAFDIRDLPKLPEHFNPPGIAWDNWEHLTLAWAIEQGWLTLEGYEAPDEEEA